MQVCSPRFAQAPPLAVSAEGIFAWSWDNAAPLENVTQVNDFNSVLKADCGASPLVSLTLLRNTREAPETEEACVPSPSLPVS